MREHRRRTDKPHRFGPNPRPDELHDPTCAVKFDTLAGLTITRLWDGKAAPAWDATIGAFSAQAGGQSVPLPHPPGIHGGMRHVDRIRGAY